ncbi:MAG: HNH endonuclease signature motif containing protein [Geminicoccaceae bacterium]
MSLRQLARNPDARYHGLSARAAKRLCEEEGHCKICGHDGSESRLGVHHRDRDKRNQDPDNLQILCHRCHMQEHALAGETGWHSYHRKRKTIRS